MGKLKPFLNSDRNFYVSCVASIVACCAIKVCCCGVQGFFSGVVCVATNNELALWFFPLHALTFILSPSLTVRAWKEAKNNRSLARWRFASIALLLAASFAIFFDWRRLF